MRTLAIAVVSTFLLLAGVLGQVDQPRPGYEGTFPSEAARQALRDFAKVPWQDEKGLLGGGTWKLHAGAVTPHALGPSRGDVMEIGDWATKGPHLRMTRDHLAVSLPTTTDGDVVATLRWLGQAVPAGIEGEPTANWRLAAARVEALGAAAGGLRAALTVDPKKKHTIDVLVWQVDAPAQSVTGKAQLRVDNTTLLLFLGSPTRRDVMLGLSRIRLDAGSTLPHQVDLDAALKAAGKPKLAPGKHEIELVLEGTVDATGATFVLRSKALALEVAGSAPK